MVRYTAAKSLHHLTGQFFGFQCLDTDEQRAKAIQRWRTWWGSAREIFVESPAVVRAKKPPYSGYEADIERWVRVIETLPHSASARDGDIFIEVFHRVGPDAVVPLSRTLKSKHERVRWWGSRALGMTRAKQAVPVLIEKLTTNPEHQDVISLGWLDDDRALQPLVETLNAKNDQVRWWTCRVLGEIGNPDAVTSLWRTWKTDPNERVRSVALVALARLGEKQAIPELIRRLESGWKGQWKELRHEIVSPVDLELGEIIGNKYVVGLEMPWQEMQRKAGTETLWHWWEANKDGLVWDEKTHHFRPE